MSYATTNPPNKLVDTMAGGPALWSYSSADVDDTVNGAGYITNAHDLGMRVGDTVLVTDTTTPKVSVCYVNAINATTGAATLAFAAVA